MSFISGFLFAVGRYVHMFFGALGVSLGGYKSCLKYGCESYCGYSTSDHIHFAMEKSFDEPWWNVIHKSQGQAIADGFIEGIENYEKGSDNMSKKIHVIKDESLGGVEREYIEVERKAEAGDLVRYPYDGRLAKVISDEVADKEGSNTAIETYLSTALTCEAPVLEPTDIVHIDGERFRMVDRKAEVGERIIVVAGTLSYDEYLNGDVFIVDRTVVESDLEHEGVVVNNALHSYLYTKEYRVLVPVESEITAADPPQSQEDIIANLVRRVSEIEQQTTELEKDNERQAFKIDDLEQHCGGLKDDIETWAREVEAIRYTNEELYSRLGHVEADTEEFDEKVEMIIDDIVTLDERTNLSQEITISVAELIKLIGGAR